MTRAQKLSALEIVLVALSLVLLWAALRAATASAQKPPVGTPTPAAASPTPTPTRSPAATPAATPPGPTPTPLPTPVGIVRTPLQTKLVVDPPLVSWGADGRLLYGGQAIYVQVKDLHYVDQFTLKLVRE